MVCWWAQPHKAGADVAPSADGGVVTPPKTAAKSPRRTPVRASPVLDASCHGAQEDLGAALPWSVCEAVTAAIWASAKEAAEAESAAAGAAQGEEHGDSSSPKRRKLEQISTSHEQLAACRSDNGSKDDTRLIFPVAHLSQPSQLPTQSSLPSQSEESISSAVDGLATGGVHAAIQSAWEQQGRRDEDIPAGIYRIVRKMHYCAQAYWRDASQDLGKAAASIARFLEQQRRLYWRRPAWRGVNLGGWLLLEPGPSAAMFDQYGPAACEYDLMQRMREQLGDAGAQQALADHRDHYITEEDFRCIEALGLNAVRIPFGYWVAVGPADGDPYAGPGLEHLDRALAWCKAYGLQAVLDLHGAPGGESGEKPCGRERKEWQWQEWRFDESVAALRVVAARYRGHPAVSGISVCNEPSETVPSTALCHFYDRAVRAIREEGMPPDEVAIILPVYRTERLDEIWRLWSQDYDGFAKHANVAFDLHLYHCFGTWWQRQSLGNQLRMAKRHRKILRRVPAVVGEWSLALPPQARGDDELEEDQALRAFAAAQLEAYSQASHGWFFWTWRDSPLQQPGWDLRKCLAKHWLSKKQLTVELVKPAVTGNGSSSDSSASLRGPLPKVCPSGMGAQVGGS